MCLFVRYSFQRCDHWIKKSLVNCDAVGRLYWHNSILFLQCRYLLLIHLTSSQRNFKISIRFSYNDIRASFPNLLVIQISRCNVLSATDTFSTSSILGQQGGFKKRELQTARSFLSMAVKEKPRSRDFDRRPKKGRARLKEFICKLPHVWLKQHKFPRLRTASPGGLFQSCGHALRHTYVVRSPARPSGIHRNPAMLQLVDLFALPAEFYVTIGSAFRALRDVPAFSFSPTHRVGVISFAPSVFLAREREFRVGRERISLSRLLWDKSINTRTCTWSRSCFGL